MAYWIAAHIQPNRDRFAVACLVQRGYEVYAPRVAVPRLWRGRVSKNRTPRLLFGTYIFVLITMQWSPAAKSPGVRRLVCDGLSPAKVPDQVIAELRRREDADGLIKLPRKPPPQGLRKGDRVTIVRGLFSGKTGLYEGQSQSERIRILFQFLGASRTIEVVADDVERTPLRVARRR